MDISFSERKNCVVCDSAITKPLLSFPQLPLTELFVRQKPKKLSGFLDQEFSLCAECGHGQLMRVIAPDVLYNRSDYFFRTSSSPLAMESNDFFFDFVLSVTGKKRFSSIVEIGCSDLFLLKKFSSFSDKLVGIDPVLDKDESGNIVVMSDLYENVADDVPLGGALVLSSHTLEHIENPKQVIVKMLEKASDETIFAHQFPSLEFLVDYGRFDQIFHQHLNYFSLNSVKRLLNDVGAELVKFDFNPHHFGSLLIAFKKSGKGVNELSAQDLEWYGAKNVYSQYDKFLGFMAHTKSLLDRDRNKKYIFGATLMLPILSYHLQDDFSGIAAVVDDDKAKQGLFYANLPIPIVGGEGVDMSDATIILGVLNNSRRVMKRVVDLHPKKIILPTMVV